MFKQSIAGYSIALLLMVLLGEGGALKAGDVSQFLTAESGAKLAWGSPGGIACDGTNFLIAAQSTNSGIIAIRLGTNGVMPSSPLDLGRTGGLARVAFDGRNFLIAWPDFGDGDGVSDIHGQFIRPDGTMAGSIFLIEADADAEQMGGLAFDGTNYLAVWESDTVSPDMRFSVEGRFIARSGDLIGSRLEISGGTTSQRFPDVVWNGENYLVIWTDQSEGTNQWNVCGRRLNRDGSLMDRVIISENPAQQAWPPTLASDGTNWLVAWSRETGPYLVLNSNLSLPMLFGRIVAQDGTPSGHEVQIRWGGLGQFKPKAAFNGENYLVGWVEKTRADIAWYWQSAVRQLNSAGHPVMTEFWVQRFFNFSPIEPPDLALGGCASRFLVGWAGLSDSSLRGTVLTRLNRVFALRNFVRTAGGDAQFDLAGPPNWSYGIEVSTNCVKWNSWNDFYPPGRITIPATAASANGSLFRAFDGQTACRENQRLIQQAKDHWALEQNKQLSDTPADSDLFGPGQYLPSKPVCPNGGSYSALDMVAHPSCSYGGAAGHTY